MDPHPDADIAAPSLPTDDSVTRQLPGVTSSHQSGTLDVRASLGNILRTVIDLHGADAGIIQIVDGQSRQSAILGMDWQGQELTEVMTRQLSVLTSDDLSRSPASRQVVTESEGTSVATPVAGSLSVTDLRAVRSLPLLAVNGDQIGMITTFFRAARHIDDRTRLLADLHAAHAARIIEHQQLTERLNASENQQRLLIAASASSIWRATSTGAMLVDARHSSDGLADSSSTDTWIAEEVHPDDRDALLAAWSDARTHRNPFDHLYRSLHADGEYHETRIQGTPLLADDGRAREWVGTITDITTERNTGAALRASDERYRTLFNSIDEGFCVVEVILDASGNPHDYRFLEANPAFEEQTGLNGVVGRTARELVPDLEPHWFEIYGSVALTGTPRRFINSSVPMQRWFDVFAFRIGEAEKHHVAILFKDITERKRIEDERARLLDQERSTREAAVATARMREEFLAVASHELKTPLTSMKAAAQLLARLLKPGREITPRIETLAGHLVNETNRLELLVADLLDASQLQQGQLKLRREQIDLATLTRDVLTRWEAMPERTEHHQLELIAPTPVPAMVDPGRVDRVLTNLISNAVKYSPDGGTVRVEVTTEGGQAVVRMIDEGVGISEADQQRLFEPFVRVGHEVRQTDGVGLGLYITAQIVDQHGGTIDVESTPQKGSTFIVRLPVTPPPCADDIPTSSTTDDVA